MTDAEYAAQKARVERYTERWLTPLGLDVWHVECCWHREKAIEERGGRPPMMETEARWQYADARLCIYLPSVAEVEDDARVEMIVVHEYMHILLAELRPLHDRDDPREAALAEERIAHEEHTATMLAKAFCRVRNAVREEGHDAEGKVDGARGDDEQTLRGAEAAPDRPRGVRVREHQGGQGAHERGEGQGQDALGARPDGVVRG